MITAMLNMCHFVVSLTQKGLGKLKSGVYAYAIWYMLPSC